MLRGRPAEKHHNHPQVLGAVKLVLDRNELYGYGVGHEPARPAHLTVIRPPPDTAVPRCPSNRRVLETQNEPDSSDSRRAARGYIGQRLRPPGAAHALVRC